MEAKSMTELDKRERRSHYRGKPRPGRRVEVKYTSPGGTHAAFTRNIGVGGAFIETDTPERTGTPLTLHLSVPTTHEPIEVRGEVRWVTPGRDEQPGGMGVKFQPLEVEELLSLNEYFASLTGHDS
jgi:uncharacterized protein (TIGR02266 family)